MRPLFAPRRVTEATPEQIILSGGGMGSAWVDPIDGDRGYRRIGPYGRDVPEPTREKGRDAAVTSYRVHPMATAVIDTIVAFAVGDSGVSPMCTEPKVKAVVDEFWNDPMNRLGSIQEVLLRSQLLLGEKLLELMEGQGSGAVRFMPLEPATIRGVSYIKGNPLWPDKVMLPPNRLTDGEEEVLTCVRVNDETGLREGNAFLWMPWRALDTDRRGVSYIQSILDWLDNHDLVLSNLIDRTAVARYVAFDVAVEGGQDQVDAYIRNRGGVHLPPSGSIEVHNKSVEWKPMNVQSGAQEDISTNGAVLTNVAAGSGLARTWLADPEDANRATSMSMAEPVRRRVGSVQRVWLEQMTELVRFAVDRAVAAKRLPATVKIQDPKTGEEHEIPASMAVSVQGPRIAAEDAQYAATVLLNLATGVEKFKEMDIMPAEAGALMMRKAWEDFMGTPYPVGLKITPESNPDDIASAVADLGLGAPEQATEARVVRLAR
jgi:hypothetical protein